MIEHDIPLTAIITPEEVISIESSLTRPKGIYWNMLPEEKLNEIPVLKAKQGKR